MSALCRSMLQRVARPVTQFSTARLARSSCIVHTQTQRHFASFSIPVPPLAESISEGTIAEISAKPGDSVNVDDVVARLETDKVSIDVRSPKAGVIKSIRVKEGDTVKVGDVLIEGDDSETGSRPQPKQQQPQQPAAPSAGQQKLQSAASSVQHEESHARAHKPLIRFTHGRANEAQSEITETKQQTSAQQQQKPAPSAAQLATSAPSTTMDPNSFFAANPSEWAAANERAFAALESLPQYYKPRVMKEHEQELIELGGATPYEVKKKGDDKGKSKPK